MNRTEPSCISLITSTLLNDTVSTSMPSVSNRRKMLIIQKGNSHFPRGQRSDSITERHPGAWLGFSVLLKDTCAFNEGTGSVGLIIRNGLWTSRLASKMKDHVHYFMSAPLHPDRQVSLWCSGRASDQQSIFSSFSRTFAIDLFVFSFFNCQHLQSLLIHSGLFSSKTVRLLVYFICF